MKKLLLIVPVLIGHTTMTPIEEASKLSCQKVKEIATSKPACMIYTALAGLSVGAGSIYVLCRRVIQAQEKLWQPGREIVEAFENDKPGNIQQKYFEDITAVTYKTDSSNPNCKIFETSNTFKQKCDDGMKKLFHDVKVAKDEEVKKAHQEYDKKIATACKSLQDSFNRLYDDICAYNVYLRLHGQKKWEVQLQQEKLINGTNVISSISITSPTVS